MSKYLADDPWLEYLYLPGKRTTQPISNRQRKALAKRIARFHRSRRTRPYHTF